ncbi:MAG: SWIM zinc finger family protein [Anaerolineae bacterium]|jgi:hypothetical protein
MDSGMISKIQKAKRYAEEPDRIKVEQLAVRFTGEHDTYDVTYREGVWNCQCTFFQQRGLCSHTMAMERLLSPMVVVGQPHNVAREDAAAAPAEE